MSGYIKVQSAWITKTLGKKKEKRFASRYFFFLQNYVCLTQNFLYLVLWCLWPPTELPQPSQSGSNVCAVYSRCPEGSGKGIYLLNDMQTARFNRWQLKHSTSDHQWCGFYFGDLALLFKKLSLLTFFLSKLFAEFLNPTALSLIKDWSWFHMHYFHAVPPLAIHQLLAVCTHMKQKAGVWEQMAVNRHGHKYVPFLSLPLSHLSVIC